MDTTIPVLRLKMLVQSVKLVMNNDGSQQSEEIVCSAVYGDDGPNKLWSKWTPCGNLSFTVSNSGAFGRVKPGQFLMVDLTPTTKDAL